MKQTAMQELRNDLVKAKEKSITALNDINNEILRKTCQGAVKLTIESIIERIDDELLEMEKQQSIDFARLCLNKAKDLDILTTFMNAQQYYNETFKQQQ
jgi:flagellin-like hook-associated protein FlgL